MVIPMARSPRRETGRWQRRSTACEPRPTGCTTPCASGSGDGWAGPWPSSARTGAAASPATRSTCIRSLCGPSGRGKSIWVRGRRGRSFPDGVQTVARGSREYYLAMGSATHWVDDTDVPAHISKPGTTTYLQARDALQEARWGGSGPTLLSSDPALDPGRWDFTLLGRAAADESRSAHLSVGGPDARRYSERHALIRLTRHATVGKGPADLISCGLPPDRGRVGRAAGPC